MTNSSLARLEFITSGALTAVIGILAVHNCIAGEGIWRDEAGTVALAKGSLVELWQLLPFESFPPLVHLLLKPLLLLGVPDSAFAFRIIGLCIWLLVITVLWIPRLSIRGVPLASLALFASAPEMIRFGSSLRAYGLAALIAVLLITLLCDYVRCPSWETWIASAVAGFLGAHCLYQFWFLVASVCLAAAVALSLRRSWLQPAASLLIGLPSVLAVPLYIDVIEEGHRYAAVAYERVGVADVVNAFRWSLGVSSSLSVIWWSGFLFICTIAVFSMLTISGHKAAVTPGTGPRHVSLQSLSVYWILTGVLFTAASLLFLLKAGLRITPWHLLLWICVIATVTDGLIAAWKPYFSTRLRMLILGLTVLAVAVNVSTGVNHLSSKYTSMPAIVAMLQQHAKASDLIIVSPVHLAPSFNYYYRGTTSWVTVPPVSDRRVQRNDLIMKAIRDHGTMVPVQQEIRDTLNGGGAVWLIGEFVTRDMSERPSGLAYGAYGPYWSSETILFIRAEGATIEGVSLQHNRLVSSLEDPPLAVARKMPEQGK